MFLDFNRSQLKLTILHRSPFGMASFLKLPVNREYLGCVRIMFLYVKFITGSPFIIVFKSRM